MHFSPLDIENAPFVAHSQLEKWGKTLAVAPHPGDESLGCGGTLALLAELGLETAVLWVSDGEASHSGSVQFPAPKLANLREAEAKMALSKLGVGRKNAYFLRLPDKNVPFPEDEPFQDAVGEAGRLLDEIGPKTLLLPWRRDPHRDHRACWQLLSNAARERDLQVFEYLVWAYERATPNEWPQDAEASAFRVDITPVLERKKAAIIAHVSQTTGLIADDPGAFSLTPEFLSHFEKSYEAWIAPFCVLPEVAQRGARRPPAEPSSP